MIRAALALAALAALACDDFRDGPLDGSIDDGGADASSPFTVIHAVPEGSAFYSVWGADADHVFAVGSDNLRYEWVGGQWKPFTPIILGQDLDCVWGTSSSNVYAVGTIQSSGQGIIQHFDGAGWTDEYVAPTPLSAVWGTGNLVLAVGAQGQIYGKTEGTTAWAPRLSQGLPSNPNVTHDPEDPILWGIAGSSIDDFAMPAGLDRVFVYQGDGGFVNLDPVVDRTIDFRAVFAVPGTQPTSYLFGTNYLGATWLTGSGPPDASVVLNGMYDLFEDRSSATSAQYIYGIWGTATRFVFVGDQGRIVTYDAAKNATERIASPVSDALIAVWGSSPSDVWIVGQRELILHGSLP